MTDGVVSVHTTQLVDLAGAETKDRVVSVTLNRPDTANAFNAQMIEGGWKFIGVAYGLTWVVLGLYAVSLWWRHRNICKRV